MISIILPSMRPHLVERCLRSIDQASSAAVIEIILVTLPDDPEIMTDVTHRRYARERNGVIDAINYGFSQATGEYVFIMNDESTLEHKALDVLEHYAKINPGCIISPIHSPACDFVYYEQTFVAFPFMSRDVLRQIHGRDDVFFDPAYKSFYADPDLCMKAYKLKIPIIYSAWPGVVYHAQNHDHLHQENIDRYLEADRTIFRSRWDHLGEFKDP